MDMLHTTTLMAQDNLFKKLLNSMLATFKSMEDADEYASMHRSTKIQDKVANHTKYKRLDEYWF